VTPQCPRICAGARQRVFFLFTTVTNDAIIPAPVTFPDECTVVVPTTANVTYHVDYGDEYTASEECFGADAELVTTDISCGTVDFTNVSGAEVVVFYGDDASEEADGDFELAPGASHRISTDHDELIYVAYTNDEDEFIQIDFLDVPQNCTVGGGTSGGANHPTVAPAAGL